MKKATTITIIALIALSGCLSHTSPYDYVENWLIRDDPARPFMTKADIIYVQGYLYANAANVPLMFSYAKSEVGNGRFNGIARVFAPLIASTDDFETAMKWYFRYHHFTKRFFIFIGEGDCGAIMREYEKENESSLKRHGLIASFYTESQHKGFVTDDMVKDIKEIIARARFKMTWGKDMPENMLLIEGTDKGKNKDKDKDKKEEGSKQ